MENKRPVGITLICSIWMLAAVGLSPSLVHGRMIYYLVDNTVYAAGEAQVNQFVSDVSADTQSSGRVFLIDAAQNVDDIRSILQDGLENEALWGAFLIGRTPYAYDAINGTPYQHLSDHPLRALSCPYEGPDENGIYVSENHYHQLPICSPDIWISRIFPTRTGAEGIEQVIGYLEKNHLLRNAQHHFDPSMWHLDSVGIGEQDRSYEDLQQMWQALLADHPLYAPEDLTIAFDPDATLQSAAFIQALQSNHEIIKINAHGTPGMLYFTGVANNDTLYSSALDSILANIKLVDLNSCSTGKFDVSGYFAGEILFNGDTLLVMANPSVTAYADSALAHDLNYRYYGLGLGLSLADLYTYAYSGTPLHFYGDPTVLFRAKQTVGAPSLTFDGTPCQTPFEYILEMGNVLADDQSNASVVISNNGASALTIRGRRIVNSLSYDRINRPSATAGFIFSITEPYHFEFDFTETISPGASLTFTFNFNPSANLDMPGPALYTGRFQFMSNDPRVGAFTLLIRGNHIYNTGDFDDDLDVEGADLVAFSTEFQRNDCSDPHPCNCDMDLDDDVDDEDLRFFAATFGQRI